jgi:hypothetical protein
MPMHALALPVTGVCRLRDRRRLAEIPKGSGPHRIYATEIPNQISGSNFGAKFFNNAPPPQSAGRLWPLAFNVSLGHDERTMSGYLVPQKCNSF